ncbi:MAG: beta-hydroxyacyl-ACP dehydratase [Bdellovibrionales bacterium]|nr:beta-hydroxyacyl-ACP dehydratase [Bdellovibrionales bacterium]MBT3525814.1 beta-hydroxyacyl-ACP dehydratase [Bdellovibrionales bacterium]MBT7669713.1 beta-hydroxyacyl-ACP dehydratase [Bdellovibrionales bacterium]
MSNSTIDPAILAGIPQRPPFLFLERIIERSAQELHCQNLLTGDEDFFKGHFPGNPIMPGVLLQESIFQTGALLMSDQAEGKGVGIITRVDRVKFKRLVRPGDLLDIKVKLNDVIDSAFYMQGEIRVAGELACSLKFTGTLLKESR